MMIGAIFWAMVDVWPTPDFTWSVEVFRLPIQELLQTMGITFVLGFLVSIILPKTPLWNSLVLSATLGRDSSEQKDLANTIRNLEGKSGLTISELFPSGQIEIDGKRFEARSSLGKIDKGENIKVVKCTEFDLVVEIENP